MTLQPPLPRTVDDKDVKDDVNACWSNSYLVDRLKLHLATVEISNKDYNDNLGDIRVFNLESRKYYNRAHHFLKIGAFKPVPPFVINLSDLTPRLIKELYGLENYDRRFVLKQSVGRMFEDIDFELYHNSISKVLRVELQT